MEWIWFVSIGLIFDVIGVIILTVFSDKTFIWILRWLGRVVDEEWENHVEQAKTKVRKTTGIGVGFLILGFLLQLVGNWIQYLKL